MVIKTKKRCAEVDFDLGENVYFLLTTDTEIYIPLFEVKEKRITQEGLMYVIVPIKHQEHIPHDILESDPRIVCSNSIFKDKKEAARAASNYFLTLHGKAIQFLN